MLNRMNKKTKTAVMLNLSTKSRQVSYDILKQICHNVIDRRVTIIWRLIGIPVGDVPDNVQESMLKANV